MFVKNMENHRTKQGASKYCTLSDYQTTIVVTSTDVHILTLLTCQSFGNFFLSNTSCHYFTEGALAICTVLRFMKKTPYLYTIDPQNLAEALGKCFFIEDGTNFCNSHSPGGLFHAER